MAKLGWRELHQAADALDRGLGERIRSVPPLRAAWIGLLDFLVGRQSDRRYMRRVILPAVASARPRRVLHAGVRGYTRGYGAFFRAAATEFWTCDIDPEAARYGAPGRHATADVRRLYAAFPPGHFDVVLLNGVFGWGVDAPEDMERTLRAVAKVLAPGGMLLIGWNHDRSPDPDSLAAIALYEPGTYAGLPCRKTFDDITHVYAWYRRKRQEPS